MPNTPEHTDPHGECAAEIARVWQPIETAPKDGTVIDLWAGGERRPGCFWNEGWGDGGYWEQQYAELNTASFSLRAEPTHWMPLPEPPHPALEGKT